MGAMDPELRAYLDDMRSEIRALDCKIDGVDSGLRAVIEDVRHDVARVAEGHRVIMEHIDRRFDGHDARWDARLQPIEATVRDHSDEVRAARREREALKRDIAELRRVDADHEARIAALERRPR